MIKGITKTQIEQIIDTDLKKMFHPQAHVTQEQKDKIKAESMKLADKFEDIIVEYNTNVFSEDYIDRVLKKIDIFSSSYIDIINSVTNKNEASAIGTIWYGFFTQAQSELNDNTSDKMIFQYGERLLNDALMARIKK